MAKRQATRVVLAFTVLLTVVMAGFASPAGAHAGDEAYAYLDVTESTLGGRIDIPVPDLEEVHGIELEDDCSSSLTLSPAFKKRA